MTIHPTIVETLDADHPGLRQHIDLRLDASRVDSRVTIPVILAEVREKFAVPLTASQLSRYKRVRWLPAKLRLEGHIEKVKAILLAVKELGPDKYAQGFILEKLTESEKSPEPAVLLREQREWARLELDREKLQVSLQKLENEKQTLEQKLKQWKAKQERVQRMVGEAKDGKQDASQTLERIREIYGLTH